MARNQQLLYIKYMHLAIWQLQFMATPSRYNRDRAVLLLNLDAVRIAKLGAQ